MRNLVVTFVLFLFSAGCAGGLPAVQHDVDKASMDVRAAVSQLRAEVEPYAQAAVAACGQVPVDAKACKELDALAGKLNEAFDLAVKALDAFDAGKGKFSEAYQAFKAVYEAAQDYANSVHDLVSRQAAQDEADAGVVEA